MNISCNHNKKSHHKFQLTFLLISTMVQTLIILIPNLNIQRFDISRNEIPSMADVLHLHAIFARKISHFGTLCNHVMSHHLQNKQAGIAVCSTNEWINFGRDGISPHEREQNNGIRMEEGLPEVAKIRRSADKNAKQMRYYIGLFLQAK